MYGNKYIEERLKENSKITRNSTTIIFKTEMVHLSVYKNSPYLIGSHTWNNMPVVLKETSTKDQFKKNVKERAITYVTL